jgi:CRP-like cAMP-binding protein
MIDIIQNEKLNNTFSQRILEKNELLFRQGDLVGDGYIINSGEIMLERNNIKIDTLGKGEVFGIFNLFFENKNRFFSAHALIKTEILIIPQKHIKKILDNSDPFVTHIFRNLLNFTGIFMIDLNKEVNLKEKVSKSGKLQELHKKMKMSA